MRYRTAKLKFSRKDRKSGKEKELMSKLTAMDKAILAKASQNPRGDDMMGLLSACRPFRNKYGANEFASLSQVATGINKLVKLGLLEPI